MSLIEVLVAVAVATVVVGTLSTALLAAIDRARATRTLADSQFQVWSALQLFVEDRADPRPRLADNPAVILEREGSLAAVQLGPYRRGDRHVWHRFESVAADGVDDSQVREWRWIRRVTGHASNETFSQQLVSSFQAKFELPEPTPELTRWDRYEVLPPSQFRWFAIDEPVRCFWWLVPDDWVRYSPQRDERQVGEAPAFRADVVAAVPGAVRSARVPWPWSGGTAVAELVSESAPVFEVVAPVEMRMILVP